MSARPAADTETCLDELRRSEARAYLDVVLELDAENRELRRALTDVVFWIAQREELLALARAMIDRRFPTARTRHR